MTVPLTLSSVPAVTPYIQYVATNGQTVFPYPFPITQDADLVCVVNGVTQNTDSGYTLSGQGNPTGGNLTFTLGRTTGDIVTLFRDVTIERITQIGQNSGFSSTAFNAEFNNVYLILQQLQESIDLSLQIPNTNAPAPVTGLLPANYANKYLSFDAFGNPTPALLTSSGALTQAILAGLLTPQTAAEALAVAVPVNYAYAPGNVLRYKTNSIPGTTDMTTGVQAALNQAAQVGGVSAYLPAGTYLVSSQLTIASNVRFYGDGSSTTINLSSTVAADSLVGSNVTNSSVSDLKFNQTGVIAAANYFGLIAFRAGSTYCKVERCEITNHYTQGIILNGTSNCRVAANYVHAANAAASGFQDSSDIRIDATNANGSSYNIVEGNYCFGTNTWHGIAMEASSNPNLLLSKNLIAHNRVGAHTGYGILAYTHTAGDTYDEILGNYVENISGSALGNNAGTGIYVALMTGVTVVDNIVVNCCTASSVLFTQGGISINTALTGAPNTIVGNAIYDMAQGNASGITIAGIRVDATPPGSTISANTVSQQATPSGLTVGIYVTGGNSGITVGGNSVNILKTLASTRGIFFYAVGGNISNVVASGNTVLGCSSRGISCEQSGGFTVSNISVNGNLIQGGGTGSVPLNFANVTSGSVSGNTALADTTTALSLSTAAGLSVSGNYLTTTGTTAIQTAGVCTGSVISESNVIGSGNVINGGTGVTVRRTGTATPGTGTTVAGDAIVNTSGLQPAFWQVTTGGTPGTFSPSFFNRLFTVTYSANMTIDASTGSEFDITANNGTAFTINAPTNPLLSQRITIKIRNTSGGALGAVTWNAVFKMSAWTQPANTLNRSIDFAYDGTNWIQVAQTGVDVPN